MNEAKKILTEEPKPKIGMYGETPVIIINDFSVCEMTIPPRNSIWIEHIKTGKGGEFPKAEVSKIIEEYFNKKF